VLHSGMSRGAPSRALTWPAARRTAAAIAGMLVSSIRESGPETLTLATTAPVRSNTGPATQHRCGSSSSVSTAYPRSRTSARCRLSSPASVMVRPVLASSGPPG
jgi:hypothetical protein